MKDYKEAFDLFDSKGKGFLDVQDLRIAMLQLGFDPDQTSAAEIISKIDKTGKGTINFENFVNVLTEGISENDP